MQAENPLLTIVIEAEGDLDLESTTYRRLLAARLHWEDYYEVIVMRDELSAASVRQLCDGTHAKYIMFTRLSHDISQNCVATLLEHIHHRTVYLAEPKIYSTSLPTNAAATKVDRNYHYARDFDIYGVAFNTRRLADALEAFADIDRVGIYSAYRLYWNIGSVEPLNTGYSVASAAKNVIGISLAGGATRLIPLIETGSEALRLHLLRYLVLYLRGLRSAGDTSIRLMHVREMIRLFDLRQLLYMAEPSHPFEAAWIRWLDDDTAHQQLFKQLTDQDAFLIFSTERKPIPSDVDLYTVRFADETVQIGKSYLDHENRPGYYNPAEYDFYGNPITEESIILFFDRPMQADDNAEHLYDHFRRTHPEYRNIRFALNPKSPDWERLRRRGYQLVHMFSPEFYQLFLESDLVVSSQIYNLRHKGKTLANSRFVYLQHGIQLNDMTDWVLSKHFDIFVATGKLEADYLGALAPRETLNSGIPRFESLVAKSHRPRLEKFLLFLPTWRFNLYTVSAEHFAQSEYFFSIESILTDQVLLDFLDRTDRYLLVQLHPNVQSRAGLFHFSDRVRVSELSYSDALAAAEMVFTDYSSVVLDSAFIGTPIAYYQWDAEDFFLEQAYESRLDYHTQGLGPVFHHHGEIIEYIVTERYQTPDPIYHERRRSFFEGVDPSRINDTIIERMLSL